MDNAIDSGRAALAPRLWALTALLAVGCSSAPKQQPASAVPVPIEDVEPAIAALEPSLEGMLVVYRGGPGATTYHLEDCSRLGSKRLPLPIDTAMRHLKPCSTCKPRH